jgi:hypothetical protein
MNVTYLVQSASHHPWQTPTEDAEPELGAEEQIGISGPPKSPRSGHSDLILCCMWE